MHAVLSQGFNLALMLFTALLLVVDRSIGAVALLMLLLSIAMLLTRHNRGIKLEQDEKLLLVAMAIYPLAVLINMLVHQNSDLADFDIASRFLLVLPIFFAVRRFGASKSWLYAGLFIGAIGAGCFGYYQKYVLGLVVAHGYISKISFGDLSLILGVLSLTYCIKPKPDHPRSKWLIMLAIIAFGFGLMGSITSGTRGGWIAIPVMLWLILREAIEIKPIRFGIYACFLIATLGVYQNNQLVKYKVDKAVADTISYLSEEGSVEGSAGTRLEMWRAAGIMFQQSPVFGVGEGEYRSSVKQLISQKQVARNIGYGHAHSEMLTTLAELGVFGLAALLAFYALLLRFFYRMRSVDLQLATAGLLLVFGYVDFGLTQAMLSHNITTVFLVALVVILAGCLSHQKRLHGTPSNSPADSGITSSTG
ncbi:O-antigen ligase family protein [Motiliproteus sp.]|uniref:O-antigen ligase family protein n=1 Tax=Motiliproteus sp. TaxID=1898955 RepID=UPI003BAAAF84